ncbi:protein DA1 [Actinoplanes sp. NPDC051470]|uniref:protein DA1 n=1 Tax=unclassified Actinoplanes TaxID=2626549 RepID=UPI00341E0D77
MTSARCTVCGGTPTVWRTSLHDEVTCATHPVAVRCVFCGRGDADPRAAGWLALADGVHRCPTCAADAVNTQEQARKHLPVIRRDMAAMGLDLPERVLVRIVPYDEVAGLVGGPASGMLLGATQQVIGGAGGRRVVEICVVAGLPELYFGRAVAHEIGHAWLGLRGATTVDDVVEEGTCELFAYAWLKRRGTAMAEVLREQMTRNPEPVYGGGFRLVHAAIRRHGVDTVLNGLLSTGRLP